jgi:serine O-acetyltransferase
MEDMTFEELLNMNCFAEDETERTKAADLLEQRYCCEIRCANMDKSVLFAHHARGCTVVAAKICKNVVIFQNVTIGSNMRYHKIHNKWENVGTPILAENVIVADGAKVFGPIIIGENTVIGAGAIITKNIPPNSIAYGVNQYKPKNQDYDLVFNPNMIPGEEITKVDEERVSEFMKNERIFKMAFSSVYPLYIQKAEKKGRAKEDVDAVVCWLTGYDNHGLQTQIKKESDFETFFFEAPQINTNAHKITGLVCGVRVESIEDPLMQKIRWLDKLVDELAKGKAMEKILRS